MAEPCFQHEMRGGGSANVEILAAPHPNPLPVLTHGCPGKFSGVVEGELSIVGLVWGGAGRVLGGPVDLGDGFALHQAAIDEFGEADGAELYVLCPGSKAKEHERDHGSIDLEPDGILRPAEETSELQVLLQPAKQQLDLPTQLVERCDLDGGTGHVVGQQ